MADAPDLSKVADSIGTKVGPLPAWGWAAIAGVGVASAIVIRRRFGSRAEPAGETVTAEPADPFAQYVPGGFVIGSPAQATGQTGGDRRGRASTDPTTNSDWSLLAQRWLIARNFQPTIVSDALSRFLSPSIGRTLTRQQQAMIDSVMRAIGPPPQPVPPAPTGPTPEPEPSPGGGGKKPRQRNPDDVVITVAAGQTLYEIASYVRGTGTTMEAMRRIARYNRIKLGAAPSYTPTPWKVGQRVRIPAAGTVVGSGAADGSVTV